MTSNTNNEKHLFSFLLDKKYWNFIIYNFESERTTLPE